MPEPDTTNPPSPEPARPDTSNPRFRARPLQANATQPAEAPTTPASGADPASPPAKPKRKRRKSARQPARKPAPAPSPQRIRPEPSGPAEAIQRELEAIRARVTEIARETHDDLARFTREHDAAAAASLRDRRDALTRIHDEVSTIARTTANLMRDHATGRQASAESALAAARDRVRTLSEQTRSFLADASQQRHRAATEAAQTRAETLRRIRENLDALRTDRPA